MTADLVLVALPLVVAAGAAGTLLFERREAPLATLAAKALASGSFVLLGRLAGAPAPILAALVLSALGDLLLVSRDPRVFRAGILAFLAAHVGYVAAFLGYGVDARLAWIAGLALLPVGLVIARRILPRAPPGMRAPVVAYMLVITAMAATAAGTRIVPFALAAALFYASDVLVARDRFVERAFWHRLVGLPMYYAAQVTFALFA